MKKSNVEQKIEMLRDGIVAALADIKAKDVTVLDVRGLTSIADFLVLCCGTSTRHLNAIVGRVDEKAIELGAGHCKVEGTPASEWMLLDLGDVIVHVMTREARDYYQLEKLWDPNWAQPQPRT
jgi:ribosome-associated protein